MQELEDYAAPHLIAQKPGVSVIHNDINVKKDCRIYNKYPVLSKFWL